LGRATARAPMADETTMKLINYVSPETVIADLSVATSEECLRSLVGRLVELGKVVDGERLLADLLARERVESTGIGGGIAIPHARSEAVVGSLVVIARLTRPIPFNAVDGEPVDLVFLLAGQKDQPGQQLRVLARISRLARMESFLKAVRCATTPARILDALMAEEAKHF
jgi:mannitol/fructose-specific phosphotransferase system IIA component (Ntr-type)